MQPRNVFVYGSTGSIGRSTLDVIRAFPGRFRVRAIAARGRNLSLLVRQAREFSPAYTIVTDESYAARLNGALPRGTRLVTGMDALGEILDTGRRRPDDVLLHGIVGAAGLSSAMAAAGAGMTLAIANKESLICGGEFLRKAAQKNGARLVPVDSEHNAVFQVMAGEDPRNIARILLTASGGPFFRGGKSFSRVTRRDALRHPKWKMGPKITVDSATLMNKALEIIEAKFLFDVPPEKIAVVIHPESIVHSMVEFVDGSVKMLASLPDMRLPIQYALFYPHRQPYRIPRLDLPKIRTLTFHAPDRRRFPSIDLAYRALRLGPAAPAVLSAANEVAVGAFLAGRIRFDQIFDVIRRVLTSTRMFDAAGIDDILQADRIARLRATSIIESRLTCTR